MFRESPLDRIKRNLHIESVSLGRLAPNGWRATGPTDSATISLYGANGRKDYNGRLAREFRGQICSKCKPPDGVNCTGMRDAGTLVLNEAGTHTVTRHHPDAELTITEPIDGRKWAKIATQIPCKPKV